MARRLKELFFANSSQCVVHIAPPKEHKKYCHWIVKLVYFMDSSVASLGYKAAELLSSHSRKWGMNSLQKFQIAGTRQQWQYGSSWEEVCFLPGSRTARAGPSMCSVVEPEMHKLCWSVGSNAWQVTLVHNTASCPRELLLQCLQIESSECHSATPGRLCPEPRNAKQMSASGISPGIEWGCLYSTQLLSRVIVSDGTCPNTKHSRG